MRLEHIGRATLYLGDCRDILPSIEQPFCLVTDPPYGVEFKGKVTKHTRNRAVFTYPDSEVEFFESVLPAVRLALDKAHRAAIFSGVRRLYDYPKPDDIGGIICPNGGGRSPWGFGCFNPILFYGRSPYLASGLGSRPTAKSIYHPGMHVTGEAIGNDHPCPKPIAFMDWAVDVSTLAGETVLDCFMGSGTTGVSCARLKRNFIGIEREPHFFDIACKRIEDAQRQGDLFAA